MKYKIIAGMCQNRGIGKDGSLPWKIKEDMQFFSKLTKGNGNNAVIMGKNTWESFNGKHLKDRDNLIISTSLTIDEARENDNIVSFKTIADITEFCDNNNYDDIWIIGGETIYKQFIDLNLSTEAVITFINNKYDCDTFFPTLDNSNWKITNIIPMRTTQDFEVQIWSIVKK
jgi:dihydrofolate reductase|tara:strand:- start:304 stop:819 length:516 start_codon:yes stop_codon:yes gene_type:complete